MNEFELIADLTRQIPLGTEVKVGPGDDCAVLSSAGMAGHDLLFKTDAVLEEVHFTRETPPEKIGRKALARCLSDIAAMAGTPTSAVVTIALPKGFDPIWVRRIFDGLYQLARAHNVSVVGGETCASRGGMFISIALLGRVPTGQAVLRSGAQVGDAIFVTGELGGSLQGKHLDFDPRLEEAQWLAAHFKIRSMIDLSDGLAGDLRHLLQGGKLGAELLGSAIPISRVAKELGRAESSGKTPLLAALTDGEDFELLFTLPSAEAVPLLDGWKKKFPMLKLSCIGRIISEPGVRMRDKTGMRNLGAHGYVHFS